MDYLNFYDLESYLEKTVRPRFENHGYLSAFDFLCIIVWKSNRSKSKIVKKLLSRGNRSLDAAVQNLTKELVTQDNPKERIRYLMVDWELNLPIASEILTILYPDDFILYNHRICETLNGFYHLDKIVDFDMLWAKYKDYKNVVHAAVPHGISLRDKARYLWGKSIYTQLVNDIGDSPITHQDAS